MNLFDAKLVKENGKYAVVPDGRTVEMSEEKQAKLAANPGWTFCTMKSKP